MKLLTYCFLHFLKRMTMLNATKFQWSAEDEIFEYPSDELGIDFTLSIDFGEDLVNKKTKEESKQKAAENFPKIIDKGSELIAIAYDAIKENEEQLPDKDTFCKQFQLEEMCLVNGEYATIYYSGLEELEEFSLTIFLDDDFEFESAEIEELEAYME